MLIIVYLLRFMSQTILCKSNPAINEAILRLKPRNYPRHAKARQVSKPVLWRDRSQACRDLLGHEKAAESQPLKNPRHAKARQVSKPILWRDRSQACQDLLNCAKANRIPSIEKSSKACGKTMSQAGTCSSRQRQADSQTKNNS